MALQRQLSKLELEFDKKTDAGNILQGILADKKIELENLRKQLKNTQDNLDHYRENIKQTREIENNLLNDKIKNLDKQLYQQQVTVAKKSEELLTLSRQVKLHEETNQAILQELNAKLIELQEQKYLMQLQITANNELSEKYNNILSDKVKLSEGLKTEKAALFSLRINLEKAQERIIMLESALEKAETKVTIVSDKNLFLVQEKMELSFQLKQMQSSGRRN